MSPLLFIRWGKIVGEIAATQLVCVVLSKKGSCEKKICHGSGSGLALPLRECSCGALCQAKKTAAAAACCPVVVYCFDAFYTTAAWLLVTLLGRFPPWRSTTSTAKDHVSRAHDCVYSTRRTLLMRKCLLLVGSKKATRRHNIGHRESGCGERRRRWFSQRRLFVKFG